MGVLTLSGRVAVVTGAAQGIGFHAAEMLCRNGMKVALVDLNAEKLKKTSEELNALPDSSGTGVSAPFACDFISCISL